MYIFIDESGIHRNVGNSSFALVYVEVKHIEKLRKQLLEINNKLKVESFHWADQRWSYRHKYLKKVIVLNFKFKVAIFDNPTNTDLAIDTIFDHLLREENIKLVAIDGKKPKWYENKLKKELRDRGIKAQKLKTIRNEISEPVLQLADVLAGFSLYVYEHKNDKMNKDLFERYKKLGKLEAQMIFYGYKIKNPATRRGQPSK